eukprot:10447379-Karenia_brevis.AAC.1
MICHENVPRFMMGILVLILGFHYYIHATFMDPYDVSLFDCDRPRMYVICLRRGMLRLAAPISALKPTFARST